MKRRLLHFGLATLTFALGVAAAVLLRPVEEAFLIPPAIPVYQPSSALVGSTEVCEVHGALMHYETVSRRDLIAHLAFTTTRYEREKFLYPNAHRNVGGWFIAGDDERAVALVCAECHAADVKWVHHSERR